jgi:hypothetical protein
LVDLLMDDHQNEAQLMSAGSDHGTFVLLSPINDIQVNLTV